MRFHGVPLEKLQKSTGYDPWFLEQIRDLVHTWMKIEASAFADIDSKALHFWKKMGISDKTLARLLKTGEDIIAKKRSDWNIRPVFKRIDACSGEYPSGIACMYSAYEEECESRPSSRKKILVLGSGPNRIGQGIEFDYCCVHAVFAIKSMGYETIMLNCNPETVSTDYDIADRLYIEPLTSEHILEVIYKEKPCGTIIQYGGQTSLNAGRHLYQAGVEILGTPFKAVETAEDRNRFRMFIQEIGLKQPKNLSFETVEEVFDHIKKLDFPLICRPSYVIAGRSMKIVYNKGELETYLKNILMQSSGPILIENFLKGALEVETDAISDGKDVFLCGMIEHIEPAGIHSGDSKSFLSPYQLKKEFQKALEEQTRKIGLALGVVGFFNVQFAIYNDEIFVLEANLRASRTIPLLSKTTKLPLVEVATKCQLGMTLREQGYVGSASSKVLGLKLPVFPFSILEVEPLLGPEMRSTGEVLCVGSTFDEVFQKARLYAQTLPFSL